LAENVKERDHLGDQGVVCEPDGYMLLRIGTSDGLL